MTNLRTITLLLIGVAMATAQIPTVGWCPDYLTMQDFDMSRYLGMWYEAERYFTILEAGSRCVRTNYTKAVDGRVLVSNEITNRLTGIKRILDGEIRHIPRGGEAKLSVKYTTLPYPVESSYGVLDTDYKTYSVVWSCSGLGLFNTQNAWVMTRERNPPASVLQKAYGVLDKFKISRSFFVKTDQTDCQIAEAASENTVDKVEESEDKDKEKEKAVDGVIESSSFVGKPTPVEPERLSSSNPIPAPAVQDTETAVKTIKAPVVPVVQAEGVVPVKQANVDPVADKQVEVPDKEVGVVVKPIDGPNKQADAPVKQSDAYVKQDPERNRKQ